MTKFNTWSPSFSLWKQKNNTFRARLSKMICNNVPATKTTERGNKAKNVG